MRLPVSVNEDQIMEDKLRSHGTKKRPACSFYSFRVSVKKKQAARTCTSRRGLVLRTQPHHPHCTHTVPSLYVLFVQSCPTLCNHMGCSLPGCSVHGILQARILGWVAMPFSRGSSQPRDRTQVSCIAGRPFMV